MKNGSQLTDLILLGNRIEPGFIGGNNTILWLDIRERSRYLKYNMPFHVVILLLGKCQQWQQETA